MIGNYHVENVNGNLTIAQGTTISIPFQITDLDDNPIDITGATAEFRAETLTRDTIYSASTTDGNLVVAGSTGTITLNIAADAITLEKNGRYELRMTHNGETTRIIRANFTLERSIA